MAFSFMDYSNILSTAGSLKQQTTYLKNMASTLSLKNILNGVYLHQYSSGASLKGALANLDTQEVKFFQYNPRGAEYTRKATFSKVAAPGMQYPVFYFSHGDEMTLSLELFMYDKPTTGLITDMKRFLETLLPDKLNSNTYKKPAEVLYVFGQESYRCIVTDYTYKIDELDSSGYPWMAHFTLALTITGGSSAT